MDTTSSMSANTYIDSKTLEINYSGDQTTLVGVKSEPQEDPPYAGINWPKVSLFQVDHSSFIGYRVEAVSLTINAEQVDAYDKLCYLGGVNKPWVEEEVTWTHRNVTEYWDSTDVHLPSPSLGFGVDDKDGTFWWSGYINTTGSHTLEFNSDGVNNFKEILNGTRPNYGWFLQGVTEEGEEWVKVLTSSYSDTTENRPYLTLDYKPMSIAMMITNR